MTGLRPNIHENPWISRIFGRNEMEIGIKVVLLKGYQLDS